MVNVAFLFDPRLVLPIIKTGETRATPGSLPFGLPPVGCLSPWSLVRIRFAGSDPFIMTRRRSAKQNIPSGQPSARPDTEPYPEAGPDPAPRHRGLRRVLIGGGLLGLLVYFLPLLVAVSPLGNWAVQQAVSGIKGRVSVQSMSLGWFSPIRLTGIRLVDQQGATALNVDEVRTSATLAGLLTRFQPGTVTVSRPVLNLSLRPDGSSLEDMLDPWLAHSGSSPDPVPLALRIENGSVIVTDTVTGQQHQIDGLNSELDILGAEAPLTARAEGRLSGPRGTGTFQVQIELDRGQRELTLARGQVEVSGSSVPLDLASPLVTRLMEPVKIGGIFNGRLAMEWQDAGSQLDVNLDSARLSALEIQAPNRIGTDQLEIADLRGSGSLSLGTEQISATGFQCQSELVNLRASGTINRQQISRLLTGEIPESSFVADGNLNLAGLINMLPGTLPLQPGVAVDSGTLQFNARGESLKPGRRMVVNLETAGLSATRQGQVINWHKPLRLVAAVRQSAGSTIIESLDCDSGFLRLQGAASPQQGEIVVEGDLQAALAEIGQVFELGELELAGDLAGRIAWQPGSAASGVEQAVHAEAAFRLEGPRIFIPGRVNWAEQAIELQATTVGRRVSGNTNGPAIRIEQASVDLIHASQQLGLVLVRPVTLPAARPDLVLDGQLKGRLETWLAWIGTIVPLDVRTSGGIDSQARMTWDGRRFELQQMSCRLDNLAFEGMGLTINEPEVQADAHLVVEPDAGRIRVSEASFTSSAVAARGRQLTVDTGTGVIQGQLAWRADVNRTLHWLGPPAADAVQLFGAAQGTADFSTNDQSIEGRVDIRFQDLIVARPPPPAAAGARNASRQNSWQRLLEEPSLEANSQFRLTRDFQQLSFDQLRIEGASLSLEASGGIQDPGGQARAGIQGTWNPVWRQLQPLVEAWTDDLVSIDNLRGGEFSIEGPLRPPPTSEPGSAWPDPELQIVSRMEIGSGTLLGQPFSGTPLQMTLNGGVARLQTEPVSWANGTLDLDPAVDLRQTVPRLVIPAGRPVQSVQLTPEMCRGWVKYVAPLVADATSASGQFSVETGGITFPLSRPGEATGSSTLLIESAQVGPGPLGQQLARLAAQLKNLAKGSPLNGSPLNALAGNAGGGLPAAWLVLPPQQVAVEIRDGRIWNKGMKMRINDVLVKTRGSVGLDQSLSLVALIPFQNKWLGNSRWAEALRGQQLRVPITGTVTHPRLDSSALTQLSSRLLQGAAGNVLNQEIQGLLNQGNRQLEDQLKQGFDRFWNRGGQ